MSESSEIPRSEKDINLPSQTAESPIDVTDEFAKARERNAERLTEAFVQGGIRLARESDPQIQFEQEIRKGVKKLEDEKEASQKQFDEMITGKNSDSSAAYNWMTGLFIFKVSPVAFWRTISEASLARQKEKVWEKAIRDKFIGLRNKDSLPDDKLFPKQNWKENKQFLIKDQADLFKKEVLSSNPDPKENNTPKISDETARNLIKYLDLLKMFQNPKRPDTNNFFKDK